MTLAIIRVALALYRQHHPRSRAVNTWTYNGSTGGVRRATCIFCRREIATCSAKWPETKTFTREADAHGAACALTYLQGCLPADGDLSQVVVQVAIAEPDMCVLRSVLSAAQAEALHRSQAVSR